MTSPAISVSNMTKKYGSQEVVKGISFCVEKGEIFGFLGPNGAGKTTSIRMIIGEIPATCGEISIFNNPVPAAINSIKQLIGVVPDYQNLYDRLSVRHNLDFFAKLNNVAETRIDEVLEEVFLTEHQHKACKDLSRGLRQRALIARGLLHRPSVFFLDEPTSALDPHSAMLIRELVNKLRNNGTTVFLTTHYMEEADCLCDRLAIMNRGTIVACGKPEELKKQFGRRSVKVELTGKNGPESREFSIDDDGEKNQMAELLKTCRIIKLHTQEARLEEVFLKVTGDAWKPDQEEAA